MTLQAPVTSLGTPGSKTHNCFVLVQETECYSEVTEATAPEGRAEGTAGCSVTWDPVLGMWAVLGAPSLAWTAPQ